MTPASIGRIVHYSLSEYDVQSWPEQLNGMKLGDYAPAIVVRTWPGSEYVNLRVFVDGPLGSFWKTSVANGDGPGQWTWPPRV